jgi:hypothetical protein
MPRVLFVGQETGGVGKSTVTRGLAEAVEEAAIIELESVHRLVEFKESKKANVGGAVRWFEMRASRKDIEETGGQAARAELDAVINALYDVSLPTVVDIGANQSASLFGVIPDIIADLRDKNIVAGVILVVAEEAGSIADAAKLLHAAKDWASAKFVVANDLRGLVDRAMVDKIADGATITTLRKFDFDHATSSMLQASALRGIRNIDRAALIREKTPAVANRILKDLTAFRLAVMEAVLPAAVWMIDSHDA